MQLARYSIAGAPRWALDGRWLPPAFTLELLLELPFHAQADFIQHIVTEEAAEGRLLAPIEAAQEVWASGVTYLRSREARQAESSSGNVYERVYDAERPELFFKASGGRVVGPQAPIRVRRDSRWNVPEPELTVVFNRFGEMCAFTAGNDVSSRDIEGENPLYLPQAKVYNGSCALGPHLELPRTYADTQGLEIRLDIWRSGEMVFQGATDTRSMKRGCKELGDYLFRELDFPQGVFLMTGTGIVPPDTFSLQPGDDVRIRVDQLELRNPVA